MSLLKSEARISVPDAAGLADRLINHLAEHDISFVTRNNMRVTDLTYGSVGLAVEEETIRIQIEATEQGHLEAFRSFVATHIIEFAGAHPPTIRWVGHESHGRTFANFREVRLKSSVEVAPHMRRLTFRGDDIARFASDEDIHVRMYFPPDGIDEPEWPRPGPDGRILWPEPERRPVMRYYTIRRISLATGEIDVDFVLHNHAGPGAAFAARAKPGAICGMAGPLGRSLKPAQWSLIMGDETALPAIARILETMPLTAKGHTFIEVADSREQIPLTTPSGVAVTWLHRNGAAAGSTDLLIDAARSVSWPEHSDVFAWIAGESRSVRTIRDHLRKTHNLGREQQLAVAYWTASDGESS